MITVGNVYSDERVSRYWLTSSGFVWYFGANFVAVLSNQFKMTMCDLNLSDSHLIILCLFAARREGLCAIIAEKMIRLKMKANVFKGKATRT